MRLIHTNITPVELSRLRSLRDLLGKVGPPGPWQAAQSLTPSTFGAPLVPNSPTCSTIQHQRLCHRFHRKARTSNTPNSSNWSCNNKNSRYNSQIQAIRLSFQISTHSSNYSNSSRSLISIPSARLTHSNLLRKELKARSQISSSKPSNACQEPTKSLKQRQISRVSASLCSRKVGREIPRLSNPRHNSKAG